MVIGDEVPEPHGGTLRLVGAEWTERIETVYNFGVEDFHTYFVGDLGAWVHNCRKLTMREAERVAEKLGYQGENAVHDLKADFGATSKHDLFVNKHGEVTLKPKNGSGPGKPVGVKIDE